MARIRRSGGDTSSTVFSTEGGRMQPAATPRSSAGASDGIVRVSRTKAGRKGKTVTLVTGIPPADLADVGKELRRLVGSGGSVKEGIVEIQGDHRDRIADHLRTRFQVKVAGG
ncbi:MAG: stress response translation initiation inhibitor YciH [Thermoleophilia bacterium]|nr:stress response translation initiation inhibitor YciH [Thermoleophilia bacterium]